MFESTFSILADRPVTVAPFLFVLWVTYRLLPSCWDRFVGVVKYTAIALAVPLFTATFLGEFTAHLNTLFEGTINRALRNLQTS